ncbi:hypothetical protein APHAL10511_003427 [Amanita phalloides]|nr:hypothetical protein APHAL10511_003427 [Amanita phalloides]
MIVVSFLATVLLALPLWWHTTTIPRLALPSARVRAHSPSHSISDLRVAHYSPSYRLAFSLLNQDANAGRPILRWHVTQAINRHFTPILTQLAPLHNFTIESQVQFYAPLAFKPVQLPNQTLFLTHEQLTVFINSEEWSLSSSASNDPVLHFVLFVPSSPLSILNPDGSSSNAFRLPQWGSIFLYNTPSASAELSLSDLDPVFRSFAAQLLSLLGVPNLSPNTPRLPSDTGVLTDWQLDTLMRRRALENAERAKDTLRSIVNLVDEIQTMPVGKDVRDDVVNALDELDEMYPSQNVSLKDTLQHSARALTLASRAYFNPGMLPLLYFPAEHKYAVYTPLFASAMIPMIVTALRELKSWRASRTSM